MIQADEVLKKGYILDLDTGKEYHLGGMCVRNNCIMHGCGWVVAVFKNEDGTAKHVLVEGRHWSHKYSVERNELIKRKVLTNFKYFPESKIGEIYRDDN